MSALDLCASCQRTFGHEHGLLVHEACVEAGGLSLARAIAAEREACAQLARDLLFDSLRGGFLRGSGLAEKIADAIRARAPEHD